MTKYQDIFKKCIKATSKEDINEAIRLFEELDSFEGYYALAKIFMLGLSKTNATSTKKKSKPTVFITPDFNRAIDFFLKAYIANQQHETRESTALTSEFKETKRASSISSSYPHFTNFKLKIKVDGIIAENVKTPTDIKQVNSLLEKARAGHPDYQFQLACFYIEELQRFDKESERIISVSNEITLVRWIKDCLEKAASSYHPHAAYKLVSEYANHPLLSWKETLTSAEKVKFSYIASHPMDASRETNLDRWAEDHLKKAAYRHSYAADGQNAKHVDRVLLESLKAFMPEYETLILAEKALMLEDKTLALLENVPTSQNKALTSEEKTSHVIAQPEEENLQTILPSFSFGSLTPLEDVVELRTPASHAEADVPQGKSALPKKHSSFSTLSSSKEKKVTSELEAKVRPRLDRIKFAISYKGQTFHTLEKKIASDNQCGFTVFGFEKKDAINQLLQKSDSPKFRSLVAPEILSHILLGGTLDIITDAALKNRLTALLARRAENDSNRAYFMSAMKAKYRYNWQELNVGNDIEKLLKVLTEKSANPSEPIASIDLANGQMHLDTELKLEKDIHDICERQDVYEGYITQYAAPDGYWVDTAGIFNALAALSCTQAAVFDSRKQNAEPIHITPKSNRNTSLRLVLHTEKGTHYNILTIPDPQEELELNKLFNLSSTLNINQEPSNDTQKTWENFLGKIQIWHESDQDSNMIAELKSLAMEIHPSSIQFTNSSEMSSVIRALCTSGCLKLLIQVLKANDRSPVVISSLRNGFLDAAEQGHLDVIEFLLEDLNGYVNYDYSAFDNMGTLQPTALHLAVQNGHVEIVKYLSNYSRLLSIKDVPETGVTPLELAEQSKAETSDPIFDDIIQILKQKLAKCVSEEMSAMTAPEEDAMQMYLTPFGTMCSEIPKPTSSSTDLMIQRANVTFGPIINDDNVFPQDEKSINQDATFVKKDEKIANDQNSLKSASKPKAGFFNFSSGNARLDRFINSLPQTVMKFSADSSQGETMPSEVDDPYTRLHVKEDASLKIIKNAYHKLSKRFHPDRGGDAEEFKKVSAAYEILKDEVKRKEYDNKSKSNRAKQSTNTEDSSDIAYLCSDPFGESPATTETKDGVVTIRKPNLFPIQLGNNRPETETPTDNSRAGFWARVTADKNKPAVEPAKTMELTCADIPEFHTTVTEVDVVRAIEDKTVNEVDTEGSTILWRLVNSDHPKKLDGIYEVLKHNANPNQLINGTTVFHELLRKEPSAMKIEILLHFLHKGYQPIVPDQSGNTGVHIAFAKNDLLTLACLELTNTPLNLTNSINGQTPLHTLALEDSFKLESQHINTYIKLILKSGINIEAQDTDGNTAILLSAERNNEFLLFLAEKLGASMQAVNKLGQSILHVAANFNNYPLFDSINEYNKTRSRLNQIDFELRDNKGNTPLLAAKYHQRSFMKLVEMGVQVQTINYQGESGENFYQSNVLRLKQTEIASLEYKGEVLPALLNRLNVCEVLVNGKSFLFPNPETENFNDLIANKAFSDIIARTDRLISNLENTKTIADESRKMILYLVRSVATQITEHLREPTIYSELFLKDLEIADAILSKYTKENSNRDPWGKMIKFNLAMHYALRATIGPAIVALDQFLHFVSFEDKNDLESLRRYTLSVRRPEIQKRLETHIDMMKTAKFKQIHKSQVIMALT